MLTAMVELQMISEKGLAQLQEDIESLKIRAKLLNQISEVEDAHTENSKNSNSPIVISSPSPPCTRSKRKGMDTPKIPSKKKKIKVNLYIYTSERYD